MLAIIPARGGSKGLPGKNIRMLGGKPLIHWKIQAALECKSIDRIILSTDSHEIADACSNTGNDVDVEVMFLFTYFGYYSNLITLLSQYNNIVF